MLQTGIVKKISGGSAEVEITRSSACGENCASCGMCAGKNARVFASNDIGAKIGDTIVMDMADKKVLGAAFLVYIVPVIMLIAGYLAGDALGGETVGIITGFLLMILTFAAIILTDKKRKSKYTPRIVEIKERSNNGIS